MFGIVKRVKSTKFQNVIVFYQPKFTNKVAVHAKTNTTNSLIRR
jgi:hypothetical protein